MDVPRGLHKYVRGCRVVELLDLELWAQVCRGWGLLFGEQLYTHYSLQREP